MLGFSDTNLPMLFQISLRAEGFCAEGATIGFDSCVFIHMRLELTLLDKTPLTVRTHVGVALSVDFLRMLLQTLPSHEYLAAKSTVVFFSPELSSS